MWTMYYMALKEEQKGGNMGVKEEWMKKVTSSTKDQPSADKESRKLQILLLVENMFFENAIAELLKSFSINVQFPLNDFEGRMDEREKNLLNDLKTYINSQDGFSHIICIADANNKKASFQYENIINCVKESYKSRNLSLGKDDICKVNQCGTIVKKSGAPNIGIWVMPNNNSKGTFADFYLSSAKINSTLNHRLDDILNKNETERLVRYPQNQQMRSIVKYLTFLAWQKEPMRATQSMFDDNNFDKTTDLVKSFKEWITEFVQS